MNNRRRPHYTNEQLRGLQDQKGIVLFGPRSCSLRNTQEAELNAFNPETRNQLIINASEKPLNPHIGPEAETLQINLPFTLINTSTTCNNSFICTDRPCARTKSFPSIIFYTIVVGRV